MESTLPSARPKDDRQPRRRASDEFVALFDEHGASLLAVLRRLCGNHNDADDVFQETAIRVWRNFEQRPWLRSPRAWLVTIAYRAFLDDRRRERRASAKSDVEPVDHRVDPPERRLQQVEAVALVHKCIDELSPEIRQVMALHYQGGLSIRQTAAAMGSSVAITKNRLHAALKHLRSALE